MPKFKDDPIETPVRMAQEMFHRQMEFINQAIDAARHAPRHIRLEETDAEPIIEQVVEKLEG